MEVFTRNSILGISIVLEAGLLLAAAAWINLGHVALLEKFQFSAQAILWGLAAALLSTSVSLFCIVLGKRLSFLAELRKMNDEFLGPLVAMLSTLDILFLSVLSGFCEEVFFRGLMQQQIGLIPAAIIFGLFHDPVLKQKAYLLLAVLAGILLGYVYQYTGNIWSCITAHIVHNLVAMLALRYFYNKNEATRGD